MSDLIRSKQLREARGKLIMDAQALVPADGKMNAELRTKVDAMLADAETMKLDIDRCEKMEALEAEARSTVTPPRAAPGAANAEVIAPAEVEKREHNAAFNAFLRNEAGIPQKYHRTLGGQEVRTTSAGLNIATGSQGAFLVPQGFVYDIETALKLWGGMREVSSQFNTSTGNPLPWPTSNDTGNIGELIAENTSVTTNTDPTIGHLTFNAYKYSTKLVNISLELLQDSAFDLDSYVKAAFVRRLGAITNNHFTVGTGGGVQPNGIVTAVVAASNTVTAAADAAIAFNDLINLEHQVDPMYRKGAKFMFADATLKQLRLLKDALGRPLWAPGMVVGAPDTINGYNYQINQDMPGMATTNVSIVFGSLDKYKIRNVQEMIVQRLVERYAEFGQIAYIGFARFDGQLLDAGTKPVAGLVHP
jgi:HK97 family phage major capsid protein